MPPEDILVAGALPGDAAGLSVMSAMLVAALAPLARVTMLTHRISPLPAFRSNGTQDLKTMTIGVQPITVHAEAVLAGRLHRHQLGRFRLGWAVGSRHAEALRAAAIPYLIWEATTLRDEIAGATVADARRSGRGSGIGLLVHKALLPLDDRLEGRLYKGAVAVLALSDYTAGRIRDLHYLEPDRVRVLMPPVTPSFLLALDKARRERRDPPVAEPGTRPLRLVSVGRLDDPRKGFPVLRDAFHVLREAGVDVTLTLVGPHGSSWRAASGLDGVPAVTFTGSVSQDELPRLLLGHDVLVVSSVQEGFGIVVSEAMHAGLPVVCTRCGGPEQVLRESGGGILVDHDPHDLAAAIRSLVDDARRAVIGAQGRAYAERELSTARFEQRVRDEVESLRTSIAPRA